MEPKKRSLGATERDEFLRAPCRAMVAGVLRVELLVFVDECSTNTSMTPLATPTRQRASGRGAEQRATGGRTSRCFGA